MAGVCRVASRRFCRYRTLIRPLFLKFLNRAGGKRRQVRRYSHREGPNIVPSPLGSVTIPNFLLHELIFRDLSVWEKKVAVQCCITGRRYTYGNLRKHSTALAAALQNKFKMDKGDVLAVALPNCPEYPMIILAASQVGVITTTVNPTYTVDEMKYQLEDTKASLMITSVETYAFCAEASKAVKAPFPVVVIRMFPEQEVPQGGIDFYELISASNQPNVRVVDTTPEDTVVIPYSSGTTGFPKGVVLSHRNLVSNLSQISHPETSVTAPTTRFHQDTIIAVLPMFHVYGLVIVTMYTLKDGCRLITMPRFSPKVYVENIVLKKAGLLYVVPPIIKLLSLDVVKKRYLRKVNFIVNGASPMNLRDAYKVLEKAENVKIVQAYGMTESSPALAHTSSKRMQKLTSIGIPVASTIFKIADPETGQPLPKGIHGELRVWGPQLMKGYLNNPEDTKNAFDDEGWLRTGDVAYYDDDGDFFIVERMKDLIKVKGFQVAPAELEEVLKLHPSIKDAAVVGIPDSEHGEVPRAYIVLEQGATITEEDVQSFMKKKLSSYKQLKGGVRFVDDFPRNTIGKPLRKALREIE